MKPSYETNDPKGWCGNPNRGAALGRSTIHEEPKEWSGKLYLQKVSLDSGGYDKNGTYFGHGGELYWYANAEGTIDAMVRAKSRAHAVEQIRGCYPHSRFFNEGKRRHELPNLPP